MTGTGDRPSDSMAVMSFGTPIVSDDQGRLRGPARSPVQLLADQRIGDGRSVHDDDNAAQLGLAGAPIEGPTHFSQVDPLAVAAFGPSWFERGCLSAHFQTMVVEGEQVVAELSDVDDDRGVARVDAAKADGTPVLTGTVTLGETVPTELDERRRRMAERERGDLFVIDRLVDLIGVAHDPVTVTIDRDSLNGPLYPFTLARKLDTITERSSWFDGPSPWGDAILPTEMLSVLTHQRGPQLPVRRPSLGLFIDLEVRFVAGPVFVGRPYEVQHEVLQVGQSRSVESWWTESTVIDTTSGEHAATVLLHQGVFKASYPDYPA